MRDAHGRASRVDNDPRRRPPDGFRLRDARRFRQLAREIPAVLPDRLLKAAPSFSLEIQDIPPVEASAVDAVALARFDPAPGAARLILYRRALEARASSRFELSEVIRSAAIDAITGALGISDPEDPWDDE